MNPLAPLCTRVICLRFFQVAHDPWIWYLCKRNVVRVPDDPPMASISEKFVTGFLAVASVLLILLGIVGVLMPVVPGFLFLLPGVYLLVKVWKRVFTKSTKGDLQ